MNERNKNDQIETAKYMSERGRFKVVENVRLNRPGVGSEVDPEKTERYFTSDRLDEKFGKEAVKEKLLEMSRVLAPGNAVTQLFSQDGKNAMNLAHAWFGPNYPLFRHSHPAFGDSLYYVLAGELVMGKRKLGPGSSIFLPKGQPYKYSAGPNGVEVLEFRAGGYNFEEPKTEMLETSLDAIQGIIDTASENLDQWGYAPERPGDSLRHFSPSKDRV